MVELLKDKAAFKDALSQEKAGNKVVAVDFTASWCGPCKVIGPIFAEFSKEYPTIAFYKVDVDENSEVAEEQGIKAMPTFKFYRNGQEIGEMVGASKEKLKEKLDEFQ